MKTMKTLINWLNDDNQTLTAPRDGDRVTLCWSDLKNRPLHKPFFGHLEALLLILALLIAFPVWAFAATPSAIPVLKESLQKGEIITAKNLTTKNMGAYKLNPRTLTALTNLIGKEATRTLNANTPIMDNYIRPVPDVHKGSRVNILYRVGNLRLSGLAKALEDGSVGDQIKIVNIDSNKVLYGQVIAPNKVEVQ